VYVWRQTDQRVYIDIKFSLDKKDSLKIKFEPNQTSILFAIDSSRNYELNLNLFDEIIVDQCIHTI